MILKTILVIFIAVTAATFGDILLSKGMKDIGPLPSFKLTVFFPYILKAIFSPIILIGISLLATYFFLWLAVLSWAELSFALPLTAITYVMTAFLAKQMLSEHVSPLRWSGTLLITLGIILVTLSGKAAQTMQK